MDIKNYTRTLECVACQPWTAGSLPPPHPKSTQNTLEPINFTVYFMIRVNIAIALYKCKQSRCLTVPTHLLWRNEEFLLLFSLPKYVGLIYFNI